MNIEDIALEVMDALRVCLCDELGEEGATCFCGLLPGSLAVADWCTCTTDRRGLSGCGMAWVRLDRAFPTDKFPQLAQGANNCGCGIAAVLEVGTYRCLPMPAEDGSPPDAASQANATLRQLADMAAIHRALTCCTAITDRPHVMGTYVPRSGGDCGGGAWPVTVAMVRR